MTNPPERHRNRKEPSDAMTPQAVDGKTRKIAIICFLRAVVPPRVRPSHISTSHLPSHLSSPCVVVRRTPVETLYKSITRMHFDNESFSNPGAFLLRFAIESLPGPCFHFRVRNTNEPHALRHRTVQQLH